MKFLDIILIIIVIIAFGTTILIYSDNYDSYNNYENYSTICNTSKQNAPYEKPQTNVFFDKNGEYITLLDEMPKVQNTLQLGAAGQVYMNRVLNKFDYCGLEYIS